MDSEWHRIEHMDDARLCNLPLDRAVEMMDEMGNTYIAKPGLSGISVTKGIVIEGDAESYSKNKMIAYRELTLKKQ